MSCFCREGTWALSLPSLSASAAVALSASARAALALDARLQAGIPGLPAGWLSLPLPQVTLPANAVATIAAQAQLAAQARAQLGIDLSTSLGATALARLTATLGARMAAIAEMQLDLSGWVQLAALNAATGRLQAAASAWSADTAAEARAAAEVSAGWSAAIVAGLGCPIVVTPPEWGGFTANLGALSMLMTASVQMQVSLSARAGFAAAVAALAAIELPGLAGPTLALMCELSAGLSAVAQLRAAFGAGTLQLGLPAVRAAVAARFAAMASALAEVGVDLAAVAGGSGGGVPGMAAGTGPALPGLPGFATEATVAAALALDTEAVGSLSVEMGASASLGVGLAVTALAANLSAALGTAVAATTPCAVCDGRAILAALPAGMPTR